MKKIIFFLVVPMVICVSVLFLYLSGGRYISTENAYVRSGIAMVSAGRSGHIGKVVVRENQQINRGDLLFVLDMEPFDLAIDQATATLEENRQAVGILKSDYRRQHIRLAAATEDLNYARRELSRVQKLTTTSAVSEEKVAAKKHALNIAKNKVLIVKAEIETSLAQLGGHPSQPTDNYPIVRNALSKLSYAKLDKNRAEVHAGISGIVAKLKMQPGEFVKKGQAVFSLVQTDNIWIEANLKETQMTYLKIGQTASFEIDAYPDDTFEGYVSSIAPASGSEFAILPPQNATGNWVKITQRIPIRLTIRNPQSLPQLRAGMSLSVSIDTLYERSLNKLIDRIFSN